MPSCDAGPLKYAAMKRLLFLIVLAAAACQPAERTAAPAAANAPAGDPSADRGKQLIAQYGCNVCHIIPGTGGPQGSLGPSLAGIASRPMISEGTVPNTPANLAQFVQNPASLNPQSSMPPIGITDDEAGAIAAYLLTLK